MQQSPAVFTDFSQCRCMVHGIRVLTQSVSVRSVSQSHVELKSNSSGSNNTPVAAARSDNTESDPVELSISSPHSPCMPRPYFSLPSSVPLSASRSLSSLPRSPSSSASSLRTLPKMIPRPPPPPLVALHGSGSSSGHRAAKGGRRG